MKYGPLETERFTIFSHEIQRHSRLGGMSRTVFQAWFHSEDVPKPICIVTINECLMDYVEWIHVDESYRRQGVATEVLRAIESIIPGITLDGATDEGEAFCEAYNKKFPAPEAEKTAPIGSLYFETDFDFSVELNGVMYSDCEFTIRINSIEDIKRLQCHSGFGSRAKSKFDDHIADVLNKIIENPKEIYDALGGNRGVIWYPQPVQ